MNNRVDLTTGNPVVPPRLTTGSPNPYLTPGNNLSDVADAASARDNLGLGSANVRLVLAVCGTLGGSSVLTTGEKGRVQIPVAGTITKVTTLCDPTGSIVWDIWKDTYANYPPTVADSITASAKPTVSSGVKSQDSTLTGWNKTINAGDVLAFNIDSVASVTWSVLEIEIETT